MTLPLPTIAGFAVPSSFEGPAPWPLPRVTFPIANDVVQDDSDIGT